MIEIGYFHVVLYMNMWETQLIHFHFELNWERYMVSIRRFTKQINMSFAWKLTITEFSLADHSHFQLVIEQLQQASQAEQHSNREDSVGVMGEEGEEELTTQTNVSILVIFSSIFC